MGNPQMGEYSVDIVMCIDATGSMAPIIEEVKKNALEFYKKMNDAMDEADKEIGQLRVKVIAFRDFICDSEPIKESPFYLLPDDASKFKSFVSSIEAIGGGDTPENAFEAIAVALKSDWVNLPGKKRHAVVVFTDAPALNFSERSNLPTYPSGMPKNLAELGSWWEGTDQYFSGDYNSKSGRLIAFVPNDESWRKLETWNRFWPAYSKAGTGLSDVSLQSAIDLLVGSF
ncbi:MAG: VWA domain-containing protein [Clostridia bacterium]|nr:VWA domain-containing protein [Clostridia bacterium]